MSDALLDVNVLLSLAWPNHQFHGPARTWFVAEAPQGWSTCATTQLGFVRLSSNPRFTPLAKTPAEALALLEQLIAAPRHRYLDGAPAPTAPPFRDLAARLMGPNQVTDAFLLATARHHGVPLVTFDARLRHLDPGGSVLVLS
jgi:toxin-antitoxin system PIN domain toxin